MVAEPAAAAAQLALPMGVVTRADVGRLADELEVLDNFLNQAAVKQGGCRKCEQGHQFCTLVLIQIPPLCFNKSL